MSEHYTQPTHSDIVVRGSERLGQRRGQYLFNSLPAGAANAVSGTQFDPYNKSLPTFEVQRWIDEHLILSDDGAEVIGVFNGNNILWEVS